jgi:hypothetical protein
MRQANLREYIQRPEKWELKIHGISKADEGHYTCVVSNEKGILRHTYTVEVLQYIKDKPILVEQSDNLTLLVGMNAHFRCKFEADLSLMTHWLRPAVGLRRENISQLDGSNSSHFEMLRDDDGIAIMGEDLFLDNVQAEDGGLYFCVGQTNQHMTPAFLHLTVLEENEAILKKPENITIEAGEAAFFTCTSHGDLRDTTSWVKLINDEDEESFVILAEGTEVLQIDNVTYNDEGIYACVVGNAVAHIQAVAHLIVQDPSSKHLPPSLIHGKNLKVMN